MKPTPQRIQTIYLTLLLFNTLAASFIWGINTLFLLDAGLSNTQAFLANAFFTVGQVIFEVPTGLIADIKGRRTSYLLGTLTLSLSTLLYLAAWYFHSSMWVWAGSSILLGLGFTFFSGATEAWLVDALEYSGFKGSIDSVFGKGQTISGIAMLVGSVGGGFVAQYTDLGVPYLLRTGMLFITFVIAFVYMHDWGWIPQERHGFVKDFKKLFVDSFEFGWRRPALRWIMLASPVISGVSFYAFYAMQPYLLALYKDEKAYAVAGLAAAIVAGSQIIGGISVSWVRKFFKRRTTILLLAGGLSVVFLGLIGIVTNFWLAILLLCAWGFVGAASQPVRQAYLNALIPSKQRATVLSFDSLLGSSGGVVIQPALGKIADVYSYSSSFLVGSIIQIIAIPLTFLAQREKSEADEVKS